MTDDSAELAALLQQTRALLVQAERRITMAEADLKATRAAIASALRYLEHGRPADAVTILGVTLEAIKITSAK